jgi:hypothetical protein
MPRKAGITTRPRERRLEWMRQYPVMHNWQLLGPFVSRDQALAWETLQHDCERSGADAEADVEGARWWGYRFEC